VDEGYFALVDGGDVFDFSSRGPVVQDVSKMLPSSRATAEIRNLFIGLMNGGKPVRSDRKLQAIKRAAGAQPPTESKSREIAG
jgi:hypothetical protein